MQVSPVTTVQMKLSNHAGISGSDSLSEFLKMAASHGYDRVVLWLEGVLGVVDGSHFEVKLAACEGDCEERCLLWFIVREAYFRRVSSSQRSVYRFGINHELLKSDVIGVDDDMSPDTVANFWRQLEYM